MEADLSFTNLWANSADDKLMTFFSFFSQKIGFDISCKLSPICMKCQILYSGKKIRKIFSSMSSAENFTPGAKH